MASEEPVRSPVARARERVRQAERRAELAGVHRAGMHARRLIRRRRGEVIKEHWRLFGVLVACGFFAALAARLFLPDLLVDYVVGGLVVVTAWVVTSTLRSIDGMANHRRGLMAEEWTTDELRKLRRKGWRIVNHVMLEDADIDHVALGRRGFIALETKFRTDWAGADLDGIARSARWKADQLQRRLQVSVPVVRPLVVIWGPGVRHRFEESFEHAGVTFCLGSFLGDLIEAQDVSVEPAQVESAFATLDQYVATRDIGEARDHGEPERPLGDHIQDLMLATILSCLTFLALAYVTQVSPAGLWALVAAVPLATCSVAIWRSRPGDERVQRAAVAVAATAVGYGLLIATAVVVDASG